MRDAAMAMAEADDLGDSLSLCALYLSQLPHDEVEALLRGAPVGDVERVRPRLRFSGVMPLFVIC